jgi:hypothetical protein
MEDMHARMRGIVSATLGLLGCLALLAPAGAGATRTLRPVAVRQGQVVYSVKSVRHRHVVRARVRSGDWSHTVSVASVRRAARSGRPLVVKVPAKVLRKAKAKAKAKAKKTPAPRPTASAPTGQTPSPATTVTTILPSAPAVPSAPAASPEPAGPTLPDVTLVVTVTPPASTSTPTQTPPATTEVPATPATPTVPTAGLPSQVSGLPSGLETWRDAGSRPLSDAAAAALVRTSPELRPANATANAHAPTADEIRAFHEARYTSGGNKGQLNSEVITTLPDVSGNFVGTTDEILQWASYKWGIPLDVVRAVAQNESNWNMSYLGDLATVSDTAGYPAYSVKSPTQVYQSLGIMQVKWKADGSRHAGTEPLRHTSTAFNVDYWAANIRFFFDGGARLWFGSNGAYAPADGWLSIGAWYNPTPWKNADQLLYIDHVQQKVARHAWTSTGF